MSLVGSVSLRGGWLSVPAARARLTRSPHAWVYAVAAVGWVVLVVETCAGATAPRMAGTRGSMSMAAMSPLSTVLGSLAMVAVMLPLVAPNLRAVGLRSPRRRRIGMTLQAGAGWAAVWVLVAAGLDVLSWSTGLLGHPAAAVVVATGVAVAWQWTPLKDRSIAGCHRLLAPPLDRRGGARAGRRYGAGLGTSCALGCAPMMALMALSGHDALVAAPLVAVGWYERRRRAPYDPARLGTSLVIAGVGLLALVPIMPG